MGSTNPPGIQKRPDPIQDAQTMMNYSLPQGERDAAADRFVRSFTNISSQWEKDNGGYMSAKDVRRNVDLARNPDLTPEQKVKAVEALANAATANPNYSPELDRWTRATRVVSESVVGEQLNRIADASVKKAMAPSVFATDPSNEHISIRNAARITQTLDVVGYNKELESNGLTPNGLADRISYTQEHAVARSHGITTDGTRRTFENIDSLAGQSFNGDTSEAARFLQRLQSDESSVRYFRDIPAFNKLDVNKLFEVGVLNDMARLDQENPEKLYEIITNYNNGSIATIDGLREVTQKSVADLGPAPVKNLGSDYKSPPPASRTSSDSTNNDSAKSSVSDLSDPEEMRQTLKKIPSSAPMMPETESLHMWAQEDRPDHIERFNAQFNELGNQGQAIAQANLAEIKAKEEAKARPSLATTATPEATSTPDRDPPRTAPTLAAPGLK